MLLLDGIQHNIIMLESILKQQQPLCHPLEIRKVDLMPTDAEIKCMEIFLDVMKPFVEITESVGGEKWVTLSLVRPLLYKLIEKHLTEDSSDSRLKKNMKRVIPSGSKNKISESICIRDP